ncbi:MAG: hypothetical protein HUJ29_04030 [Gammaproteobacteria bacterium]|nr:hypothetical protein [Gammaproteobacteria bacterium]
MMTSYWISLVIAVVLLVVTYPYAMKIRHPDQKPLAAYFIFVSVFVISVIVIYTLLLQLAEIVGLTAVLNETVPALVFIVLVFVPSILLARWWTRKPPKNQGPPP